MTKKKNKKSKHKADPAPRSRSLLGAIRHFIGTVLSVLVILYVAALVISRTNGFRGFVAEKVGDALGMPVTIDGLRLDLRLDVHLEGLRSENSGEQGVNGIALERGTVRWCMRGLVSRKRTAVTDIELQTCDLSFAPARQDGWAPEGLGHFSKWLAEQLGLEVGDAMVDGESGVANDKRPRARVWSQLEEGRDINLRLSDSSMVWWDPHARELARVTGLNLLATPLESPGRKMTHYILNVGEVRAAAGPLGRDLSLELLRTANDIVILGFTADRVQNIRGSRTTSGHVPTPEVSPVTPTALPPPGEPEEQLPGDAEDEFRAYIRDALSGALEE